MTADFHVYVRQAVEGRKAEIYLSQAFVSRLAAGDPIEAIMGSSDSEIDDTTSEPDAVAAGDMEPTQLVEIRIVPAER